MLKCRKLFILCLISYILNLTSPKLSGNWALTTLSQNVVTSFDSFSSGEIMIKLNNEFKTISKS